MSLSAVLYRIIVVEVLRKKNVAYMEVKGVRVNFQANFNVMVTSLESLVHKLTYRRIKGGGQGGHGPRNWSQQVSGEAIRRMCDTRKTFSGRGLCPGPRWERLQRFPKPLQGRIKGVTREAPISPDASELALFARSGSQSHPL